MEPVGAAVAESLPIVKFLVKLAENLKEKPTAKQLGLLACTIAFQKAAESALLQVGPPANRVPLMDSAREVKQRVSKFKADDPDVLLGFSLSNPAAHPFVNLALQALRVPLLEFGYSEIEIRRTEAAIRDQFKSILRDVMSDTALREKFAPFTDWAQLGGEEDRAHHALQAFADAQRRAFAEKPVLGQEPFALADVYIETDCGELLWKEIKGDARTPEKQIDAFEEKHGGRKPVLGTVLRLLGDKNLKEPIVIQGGPGAGKTAFTLRLSRELQDHGLVPIRIRIRDLRIDLPLVDALSQAITESDDVPFVDMDLPKPASALLRGEIFDQTTQFGEASISRFVLILDGWDEVSTAEKGYQIQVKELLQNVRNELVRRRTPLVRVVLTGRPSDAIDGSNFLADHTPVLTMRQYTPEQLKRYATNLALVMQRGGSVSQGEGTGTWKAPDPERLRSVFAAYRDQCEAEHRGPRTLDVLGQPLLAHLAIRVISECTGKEEIASLVASPTRLYRQLVDLTCGKAGKAASDSGDTAEQARIRGYELRRKLHRTAAAITAWGQESIPFGELTLRARLNEDEGGAVSPEAHQERPWTRLMISFYFKGGGEHHGCEFLHKSFREYLFAEGIIETVKECATRQTDPVPVRDPSDYWRDFTDDDHDQRFRISRSLGELLSSQWLTPEVSGHVQVLLEWEIHRSAQPSTDIIESTAVLTLEQWETARDLLAELWHWWAEGVHLRPQPHRSKRTDSIDLEPPYVQELVDLAMQRERTRNKPIPVPPRTTTIDGHLGDGLFRLNTLCHFFLALDRGWTKNWTSWDWGARSYQTEVVGVEERIVLFSPSGRNRTYFRNYIARINASGWTQFPAGRAMPGVDFSGRDLYFTLFSSCDLRFSNFARADARYCYFGHTTLAGANLQAGSFEFASFEGADLENASIDGARLHHTVRLASQQINSTRGANSASLPEHLEKRTRRPKR